MGFIDNEIIPGGLTFGLMTPRFLFMINKIIIHHADAVHCTIKDVDAWHKAKGWAGCGYNYFINKYGQIYKGRPERYVGANCAGQNTTSIGICLEGKFTIEKPTPAQIVALKRLVASLKQDYPNIKEVGNHKDYMSTACPVVDLKNLIK